MATAKKTTTATKRKSPSTAAKPAVVTAPKPVVAGPTLKKSELLERVLERSGIKKKDAKPVVEAMLAVLGEAIASGEELNLQPFGKLKINNEKDLSNGRVINCRIRQSKKAAADATPDTI